MSTNYDKYLRFNEDAGYKISDKRSVWVPDKEEGYLRATVESEKGTTLQLKMPDGALVEKDEKDVEPANPGKFDGVADCAELSHLNDATVLHNLRVRYAKDLIHTSSGLFLVVVNPYKWIPIYTDEMVKIYNGRRRNEVHPHVYAIADEAYRAMLVGKRNQSMLITGESGAGKTENTKKVIQYLATIAGKGGQGKLEQQILQANPMLEAFGNAKTNKNDNSSRFGKFIRVQFNAGGVICGTVIQVYLLEKSRVVHQGVNERTFHIFYQMLAGCDAVQNKRYHLGTAKDMGFFVDKNAITVKGMDDSEEWKHTKHAMDVVGVTEEEQDNVLRIMAGIMQAGNLQFKASYGSEGSSIGNPEVLDKLCELWQVNRQQFERALIRPRIKAGTEIVEKHLSVEQAQYSRDAMCKAIYERVFLWLVKKLNRVLEAATEASFIGVLDIAGFEIFVLNSFEQLCINFTNEKLQQFFNNHMFKLEQEEYEREKIVWKYVDFGVDSQQTIELIEKKPNSIMSFLDEESIFPRATNKTLIDKLHTLEGKHPKYSKVQFKDFSFRVAHYAGDVIYDISNWIEKNKDPLQDDIAKSLIESPNQWVSNLFQDPDLDPRERIAKMKKARAPAAGRSTGSTSAQSKSGSGASFMTVASTYKEQLGDLMETLESTEPHFIRCIIPNLVKRPLYLKAELILEQLRCNGVLEGIRISRKGFPNRLKYAEMLKRYYLLHDTLRRDEPETKEACKKLMAAVESKINAAFADDAQREKPYFQFGETKLFFRHGVLAKLEEWREQKLSAMVVAIQSAARGWLGRSAYKKINLQSVAAKTVQKNVQAWLKFRTWMWWKLFNQSKPLQNRVDYDAHLKELQKKSDELTGEVARATKTRDELKSNLEETSAALNKVTDELDDCNSRLSKLEAQRKSLDGENSELNETLEDLEGKIATLKKSQAALQGDFAEVSENLQETKKRLNAATDKRKELEELKRKHEGQISTANSQLADLREKEQKLKAQLAQLEADLSSTTGDAEGAQDRAAALQKRVTAAQGELEGLQDEVDTAKREKAKLEASKKDLEARLKEVEDDLDSERAALTAAKAQQSKLQGELDELQANLDKAQKEGEELARNIKKAEQELADANSRLAAQKDARAAADKKGKSLASEKDQLDAQKGSLEGDKSKLEAGNKQDRAAIEDLEAQVAAAEDQIAKLKKQVAAAEEDLARVKSDLEAEERARADLEGKAKKLQGELRDAQEELEDAKTKGASITKSNAKLEKDLKDAQDALADAESRKAKLQAEATAISGELSALEDDLEAAEKRAADQQRAKSAAEAALADAKAQLEEEQEDRARAEKAKKAAESQLADLQREIDGLSAKNSDIEGQIRKKAAEASSLASAGGSAELSDAKQRFADQAKRLIEELNDARSKFADAEQLQRTYDREVNTLTEVKKVEAKAKDKSEKDEAQLEKERKEAEQKTKEIHKEVEAAKSKSAALERELKAARAELDALRDVLQLAVKTSGGAIRG